MELLQLKNWDVGKGVSGGVFISFLGEERSVEMWDKFSSNSCERYYLKGSPLASKANLEGAVELDIKCLLKIFRRSKKSSVKDVDIVLEISSMPKAMMAEIVSCCFSLEMIGLRLRVIYALAKFMPPIRKKIANRSIEPIHTFFSGWSSPDSKPTSLILGLGYEPHKAEGAAEFFEPNEQWLFKPTSPIEKYLEEVESNNANLLKDEDGKKIVMYPVEDPEMTFGQVGMAINSLLKKTNPVILPFGPKIFFFICLVHGFFHRELGVWEVLGGEEEKTLEVFASQEIVGMEIILKTKSNNS